MSHDPIPYPISRIDDVTTFFNESMGKNKSEHPRRPKPDLPQQDLGQRKQWKSLFDRDLLTTLFLLPVTIWPDDFGLYLERLGTILVVARSRSVNVKYLEQFWLYGDFYLSILFGL